MSSNREKIESESVSPIKRKTGCYPITTLSFIPLEMWRLK